MLDYVRHSFRCEGCEAKGKMVKPSPPAVLPRTLRFNETVGIDLFTVPSFDGTEWIIVNLLCWGTLFQLAVPIPDKAAKTVAVHFLEHWIRYFGPPTVVIADQGREFIGKDFTELCDAQGILWQNGRTELHGDMF